MQRCHAAAAGMGSGQDGDFGIGWLVELADALLLRTLHESAGCSTVALGRLAQPSDEVLVLQLAAVRCRAPSSLLALCCPATTRKCGHVVHISCQRAAWRSCDCWPDRRSGRCARCRLQLHNAHNDPLCCLCNSPRSGYAAEHAEANTCLAVRHGPDQCPGGA
jgi:hypothetical protein